MSKAIQGAAELAGGIALEFVPGGQIFGSMLVSAGISTEMGALAAALGSKAGIGITTRTAAALRQIIRGEQRVGGNIVYCSTTGSTKRQYNMVIVLAGHPCHAIENLYLDGRQVYWDTSSSYNQTVNGVNFGGNADGNNHTGPNGVQYNFGGLVFCAAFQGRQTPSPTVVSGSWVGPSTISGLSPASYPGFCSALQANDPTWAPTSAGTPYLGGCTYVYLKIEADAGTFPQFPEIRFTVRGKDDIYDPRTGLRGYTKNWALHVADMITDPTWGLGDAVNEDQLIAAANICDEQVGTAAAFTSWEPDTDYIVGDIFSEAGSIWTVTSNYTSGAAWGDTDPGNVTETPDAQVTEARWELHWHYDAGIGPGEAIEHAMPGAQGRISHVGDGWFIYPAAWTGPSFSFDENSILDAPQWQGKRGLQELCNRVTGTYIAPNYPYNVAGDLYDSNGFWNGETQNNFPYSFQPTNVPEYACDPLHGYGEDVYLIADTPNLGAWASGTAYAAGAVVIYSGVPWQANEAVPAGSAPGSVDGSGNPYWSEAGNYLPIELTLDTVLSISQAQRAFKIALLRNRQEGHGSLTMPLAAYQMIAVDVMQFSFQALSWSNKLLEVAGLPSQDLVLRRAPAPRPASGEGEEDETPAVWVEVPVNETDPSVYDDLAPGEELTPYDVPAYTGSVDMWNVAAPTGLTVTSDLATALVQPDGTVIPQLLIAWTEPADTYVTNGGFIEVQSCLHGTAAWQDAAVVSGQTTQLYVRAISAQVYDVRIRAIRPNGAQSAWAEVDGTVAGFALSSSDLTPVAPAGTVTAATISSTDSMIVVNPFTATLGSYSASCLPSGAVTLDGYTPLTYYYVYYVDPSFAGGAITPVVTTNPADFVGKPGYFLIGTVTTPAYNSGGGGSGSATYSPSNWANLGQTSIGAPTAAYDHNTSTAATVVGQYILNPMTHVLTAYNGECQWSGFPAGALSYAATLTVIASVTGPGAWSITSSLGSLASGTGASSQQAYTIAVPAGTDLSTVTVTLSASAATGGQTTVSNFETYIQ